MANEKRLIDAYLSGEIPKIKTPFAEIIVRGTTEKPYYNIIFFDPEYGEYEVCFGSYYLENVRKWLSEEFEIVDATTVDAVEVELFNALKSLVNGEWVDCKLVQEALGIEFNTGFKMFDFSRTAEWNPAPLNGQKITTKFKLKNSVEVVHGRWEQVQIWATKAKYRCSVCGREIMSATKVNIEKYPYCHCGAKMDGDGNG